MMHVMGFPMALGIVFWIAVLALVLAGAVLAIHALRPGSPREQSAAQLLDRRFAAGEIEADEYYERRAGLRP